MKGKTQSSEFPRLNLDRIFFLEGTQIANATSCERKGYFMTETEKYLFDDHGASPWSR